MTTDDRKRHPKLDALLHSLHRAVTHPSGEVTRWHAAARFAYDLGRYGAVQLKRDRAPQMAGALAFRTLFSLIPVLVVGAVVVRAVRGPEQFVDLVRKLSDALGLYEIGPAGSSLGHLVAGGVAETEAAEATITSLVDAAASINVATIGWVGLAVLIYSAVSLMVTIENSFNGVYRAPAGRAWLRRLPMYWFVLTVGPVVIGVSFYVDAKVNGWIGSVASWQWLISLSGALWSLATVWLFLLAVYALVPNTAIAFRSAFIGAGVAAILLLAGKKILGAYLSNAFSVNQFNGALGLIPLFMFWVYLMWLFVLFGLEVASTLQMLAGRGLEEFEQRRQPTGLVDPLSILTVMEVVSERFDASEPTTARQIADDAGLPEVTVRTMLERLVESGLLHRLEKPEGAVALARPPERIEAAALLDLGYRMADEAGTARRPALLERLRDAQRRLVTGLTLARPVAS